MHSFGSASDQEYLNYNANDLARYYVMCKGSKLGLKFYELTGGGDYKHKFGVEKIFISRLILSRFGLIKLKRIIVKIKLRKFRREKWIGQIIKNLHLQ